MQCDDDRVRELLEAPPPWLVEQLARLREDPDRFAKPTFAAVAAEALGDARRWSEVEPILEEVCR
jgi:hypothetical protein